MKRSGPPPKPTRLKLVEGTLRRDRTNDREPRPEIAIPEAPPHLSPEARKAWPRFAAWLFGMRILTVVDAAALEQACETYGDLIRARRKLRGGWYQTVATKSGDKFERIRPAVAVVQDADRRLRAWLTEFGLTPSSRSRVKTEQRSGQGQIDPLAKYCS